MSGSCLSVSVALATCNGERFLKRQLDSIAAQTVPPAEIVAVDDASTDSTRSMLDAFAGASAVPVRLFENAPRLGATRNFERAIGLCTGDVIVLADQDDWWQPDKLAVLRDELVRSPRAIVVFSDARLVDDAGQPLGRTLWEALGIDTATVDRLAGRRALAALTGNNLVPGSSMAFRAELRRVALPFPTHLPNHVHDGWLAVLAAAAGGLRPMPRVLMDYRLHPDQQYGVPEAPYELPAGWRERGRTRPDFSIHLEVARAVSERLATASANAAEQWTAARSVADDLVRHLGGRASLPPRLLRRAGPVGRELARGGYHRWARGARTAVKDLVSPATTVPP